MFANAPPEMTDEPFSSCKSNAFSVVFRPPSDGRPTVHGRFMAAAVFRPDAKNAGQSPTV
jgi:hypothetical protein